MADNSKSYIVRADGSPTRVGKVFKKYPYTLRELEAALEDGRLRSHGHGPQVLVVTSDGSGRSSAALRTGGTAQS